MSSCGYQYGHGPLLEKYSSMSIPYIGGDKEGRMTAELVRQLSSSGSFTYKNTDAELKLHVKVLDSHEEHVGYQFARDTNNQVLDAIVPTEGRLRHLVEVSVEEVSSGKILLGPKRISADVDFDFDPDLSQENVTSFSLGQFSAVDSARDVAERPLGKEVAKKIVSYVNNSW
jgi:hypothetical protein